jgi:hypothetical protein
MLVIYDTATGNIDFTLDKRLEDYSPGAGMSVVEVASEPENIHAYQVLEGILTAVDIEAFKKSAITKINTEVGRVRLQMITDLPGQELIYKTKEEQARRYLTATPEPADLTEYRMIASEVTARGISPYQAAQLILNLAGMWELVGGALEDIRLTAAVDLESVTTKVEIDGIEALAMANIAAVSNQIIQE